MTLTPTSTPTTIEDYKKMILDRFDIDVSDSHNLAWAIDNVKFIYSALANIDGALNSHLKSFLGGKKYFYHQTNDNGKYSGFTSPDNITFHFGSNTILPHQLIYHEMGHLLNYSFNNKFDHDLENGEVYTSDGELVMGTIPPKEYIRHNMLGYKNPQLNDPSGVIVQAILHPAGTGDPFPPHGNSATEDWGDLFANYVANNIDLSTAAGRARLNWLAERIWQS
jgi:hypothetical protein